MLFLLFLNTIHGFDSYLSKSTEKATYPKKVILLKKHVIKSPQINTNATLSTKIKKSNKNINHIFKDLSEDDIDFINELNKQFKVHGDNLKIKIEHENTTDIKNLKRTLDGELGYGYKYNDYEYSQPKFMFYPYSQNDIVISTPRYYPNYGKTSVTIEPSYSYELRPQSYEYTQIDLPQQHYQREHHQQQDSQQQYEEPIIVLRIPGSTKYASHIQALLQQYLEIRAKQYLRILEQTGLQKLRLYTQAHEQNQHQQPRVNIQQEKVLQPIQQHYYHTHVKIESPPTQSSDTKTSGEVFGHQIVSIPQSVHYPDIHDVYQIYKNRHQNANQAEETKVEMVDYYKEAQAERPIYVQDEKIIEHAQPHQHNLHISENNPRKTHTKILFTSSSAHTGNEYIQYPLPSIRPFKHIALTSTSPRQQHQQQSEVESNSEDHRQKINQDIVTITQRPYNYHAHAKKMKIESAPKRVASVTASEDDMNKKLEKIHSFIQQKFGAQTGSASEYQTVA